MNMPDGPIAEAHVPDELLAALTLGDGPDEIDAQSRAHVAHCERCTTEVAALREALSLVSVGRDELLTSPPLSVWEAVSAEIEASAEQPAHDASPMSGATVTSLAERRRRVPTWLAATAAAVALAAGVGVGTQLVDGADEDPDTTLQVLGSTSLVSLDDAPAPRGAAEVLQSDDKVVLSVAAADLGGPEGTREVWLINTDGARMVSLGLLADGEAGDFEFPERLLEQGYRIVDISYEPDDGDPLHSGKSLARGTLEV